MTGNFLWVWLFFAGNVSDGEIARLYRQSQCSIRCELQMLPHFLYYHHCVCCKFQLTFLLSHVIDTWRNFLWYFFSYVNPLCSCELSVDLFLLFMQAWPWLLEFHLCSSKPICCDKMRESAASIIIPWFHMKDQWLYYSATNKVWWKVYFCHKFQPKWRTP